MIREKGPTLEEALAIADLICTSARMNDEAWSVGHKLQGARRNVDGVLEVFTESPDQESGHVFALEERCEAGKCRLIVRDRYGWIT